MSYAVPLTRREAIVHQLRHEIVTGALPPGTVVKDAEVAARLGVSITPVREAIAQLAAEGLIDIAPNRTRRVTHVTQKNALELIDVIGVLASAGVEWGGQPHREPSGADAGEARRVRGRSGAGGRDGCRRRGSGLQHHHDHGGRQPGVADACRPRGRPHAPLAGTQRRQRPVWQVWIDGYRDILDLLERGERPTAVVRYRAIYREYRPRVQALLADPPTDPVVGR